MHYGEGNEFPMEVSLIQNVRFIHFKIDIYFRHSCYIEGIEGSMNIQYKVFFLLDQTLVPNEEESE